MAFPFPQTIKLEDLPQWSPWPARLLGLQSWNCHERTLQEIEREYDRDKYGALLQYLGKYPSASPEELRAFEFGGDLQREICVSMGETLYRTTLEQAADSYLKRFLSLLEPFAKDADALCELGCGWGYMLSQARNAFPRKKYWGGDYSANGVAIAQRLFGEGGAMTFGQIDFTDPNFQVPFKKEKRVVLFTVYGFDNLPSAKSAIERLIAMKGPDWHICHFEPVFEWCSQNTLGLLRCAYTIQNDYNRDLLSVLESHTAITIERMEREYFGINPLHPASFVSWR